MSDLQKCHLHSVAEGKGVITAQHRQVDSEATGFTFLGCKVTGINSTYLGRPWGAYSRVVFAYTFMSRAVLPTGWDDWIDSTRRKSVLLYLSDCILFFLLNHDSNHLSLFLCAALCTMENTETTDEELTCRKG